ncbi:MBL fold metallo-hydrolase [Rhizobiaceae bacterium n13]|uniref:MBL fold metallo-hydrolase n=1 Tax=Ferirhizobium litorale TaxID=2927786 RepID=A0AAE3QI84_9HYPH|nr:MBL fold metallo-hydrolase [Fererhizobium litorale]MDI7864112.1 MBL fold metallo-hydrolase [Fererhizobium litorale]MDI7924435.1 MBL fold metallo-hydrolase [Fererhizobium litorale]
MAYRRRFTILGCSSSPGVPRINGDWGDCDPNNPKNRRTRAAFMVEQIGPDGGRTTVVFDTGPDFRAQMIAAKVKHVDGVLYTHAHADHIHGIDDLRGYFVHTNQRIPIHADAVTMARIREGFAYCLETPAGSGYPAIVDPRIIDTPDTPVEVLGAGGTIRFMPLLQQHGAIHSLGFRTGGVAYCSDVSGFPPETIAKLRDLDVLVVDALQYRHHPSHFSLQQALDWIEELAPKRAILTHMHTPLDYETVLRETPPHVEPAFDQMQFEAEYDPDM